MKNYYLKNMSLNFIHFSKKGAPMGSFIFDFQNWTKLKQNIYQQSIFSLSKYLFYDKECHRKDEGKWAERGFLKVFIEQHLWNAIKWNKDLKWNIENMQVQCTDFDSFIYSVWPKLLDNKKKQNHFITLLQPIYGIWLLFLSKYRKPFETPNISSWKFFKWFLSST